MSTPSNNEKLNQWVDQIAQLDGQVNFGFSKRHNRLTKLLNGLLVVTAAGARLVRVMQIGDESDANRSLDI